MKQKKRIPEFDEWNLLGLEFQYKVCPLTIFGAIKIVRVSTSNICTTGNSFEQEIISIQSEQPKHSSHIKVNTDLKLS